MTVKFVLLIVEVVVSDVFTYVTRGPYRIQYDRKVLFADSGGDGI